LVVNSVEVTKAHPVAGQRDPDHVTATTARRYWTPEVAATRSQFEAPVAMTQVPK